MIIFVTVKRICVVEVDYLSKLATRRQVHKIPWSDETEEDLFGRPVKMMHKI